MSEPALVLTEPDTLPVEGRKCACCPAFTPPSKGSHPRKYCDECRIVQRREHLLARKRRWYERNAESARADMLARYLAKRPERQAKAREWKRQNPGRVSAGYRAWALLNREALRLRWVRRATRLRDNHSPGVSLEEKGAIMELFNGRCAWCPRSATELDHLDPVARGGRDEAINVIPSCRTCNASKGAKTLLHWLLTPGSPSLKGLML